MTSDIFPHRRGATVYVNAGRDTSNEDLVAEARRIADANGYKVTSEAGFFFSDTGRNGGAHVTGRQLKVNAIPA